MSKIPTALSVPGLATGDADAGNGTANRDEERNANKEQDRVQNLESAFRPDFEGTNTKTSSNDGTIDLNSVSRRDVGLELQDESMNYNQPLDLKPLPGAESTSSSTTSQGDTLLINPIVNQQGIVNTDPTTGSMATVETPHVYQAGHTASIYLDEASNHEGPTNLEIDSDETDSAIGDMTPISSTASLRSSIYDVIQENGRTYHRYKEGKYLLPNDEVEQERLDLQHHLCLLSLEGKLHIAPTGTDLRHVLDIGTGTGIWAIEFALQHPNTSVIGSDLSPIQPTFVPINCRFEVDDAEDVWAYSHNFDFIHGRMLFSCFKDPAGVIASAFKALEQGRYFEMMDVAFPLRSIDDSLKGTALGKWCSLLIAGAKVLGKDWTCTSKYPKYFEDAGFVDVQVVKFHWPTNAWAKSEQQKILGRWLQQNLLDGVSAMSMAALTRGLKMSPAEVELFLVDVRNDIQDRHIHAYCPIDVVYGRKPE